MVPTVNNRVRWRAVLAGLCLSATGAAAAAPAGGAAQDVELLIQRVFDGDGTTPQLTPVTLTREEALTEMRGVCAGGASPTAACPDRPISTASAATSTPSTSRAGTAVYRYQAASPYGAVLTLVAEGGESDFTLSAYELTGQPLVATPTPGPEQRLFVPAAGGRVEGLVEVTLQPVRDESPRGFTLQVQAVGPADRPRALGHAQRLALAQDQYQALVSFGRCDSADPGAACDEACPEDCQASVHAFGQRLVDQSVGDQDEPVVAFIGVAGVNRLVLLDRSDDDAVPPHHRSLGRARDFWVVYIEDELVPFSTSIDVQFRARATVGDFEEFDPAGLVNLGVNASSMSGYRVVEVGVRRFRVRPPPVAVEVTISRQGPGYGLRQWRRAYRVYGWRRVQLGGGVFIPATEVFIDRHEVIERAPFGDQLPFDSIINKTQVRRPVFLALSVLWPERRARVDNALGGIEEFGWRAIPEIVVGVGLPFRLTKAWYVGASWPIAWDRLSFTMGTVLVRQTKLLEGYHVGQRLPLHTPVDPLTYRSWVSTFTLGVTVDLVRSQ